MNTFSEKLQVIHHNIDAAKKNVGRNDTVTLCAVSKTQPAETVRACYAAGQRVFGENYVQEAITKQAALTDCDIEWHFIGPIQSNKTQPIAQHFDWVHSVDRFKIAKRLSDARPVDQDALNVCIQVNVSEESTKSGAEINAISELAAQIRDLPNLNLRGVMAIPAPTDQLAVQQAQFAQVKAAYDALCAEGYALDTLSIGMSADYPVAITAGATIVRVGTAIFGARQTTRK